MIMVFIGLITFSFTAFQNHGSVCALVDLIYLEECET